MRRSERASVVTAATVLVRFFGFAVDRDRLPSTFSIGDRGIRDVHACPHSRSRWHQPVLWSLLSPTMTHPPSEHPPRQGGTAIDLQGCGGIVAGLLDQPAAQRQHRRVAAGDDAGSGADVGAD